METGWSRGYVHVYTGDGKGKTTAAVGLAVRAIGAGLTVFFGQFIKGRPCGETRTLARLGDAVTVRFFGRGRFIREQPGPADKEAARQGLAEVEAVLTVGAHRVVILDEANVAAAIGLFPVERLLDLIHRKPAAVELVLTGRGADARVLEAADLVTDMRAIKHYYTAGVQARSGIEG